MITRSTFNKSTVERTPPLLLGYESVTDRFVVITDEELTGLKSELEEKSVEILGFVKLKEVDPVFYDKTYYLAAETNGLKAYALLRESLFKAKKIGIDYHAR